MKRINVHLKYDIAFLKKYFESQYSYLRLSEDYLENRESFFRRVGEHFYPLSAEYRKIEKAYNTAKRAFDKKYRQTGERYFEHLRGVALILMIQLRVSDVDIICAALLHDIVEDIPGWTVERVRAEFGDKVAAIVEQVTNPDESLFATKEECLAFLHKRQKNMTREAVLVKLADRLHNLFTLWTPVPKEKILRKLAETENHYLPMAETHAILYWDIRWMIELHRRIPNFRGWLFR